MGDWGLLDDEHRKTYNDIVPQLKNLKVEYSLVVFLGDMAYDLCNYNEAKKYEDDCSNYPLFLKGIEFLTSKTPFMLTLGNHEYGPGHPFAAYFAVNSFLVSEDINLYSFEVGNVHFQSMNNFNETKRNDTSRLSQKIDWLIDDYKTKSEDVKWVIPFSHYPFYCERYGNDSGCVAQSYNTLLGPLIDYFHNYQV